MIENKITILLATYQGSKYITEQLNSIINQSYSNWELYVRDDCSGDNTLDIIKEFTQKDSRIHIHENKNARLGASQNFAELMSSVPCDDYIMFCDQDDVWFDNKVEVTLRYFLNSESKQGKSFPLLVHTDFQFTDEVLNNIDSTTNIAYLFSKKPEKIINKLVSQNYIYGCTMMINKSLLDSCLPFYHKAENHDYWIALVAASVGKIDFLPKKTIFYRQHNSNVTNSLNAGKWMERLKRVFFNWEIIVRYKNNRFDQIVVLKEHLGKNLKNPSLEFLNNFICKTQNGGFTAVIFAYKNDIRRQGFIQTGLYYLALLKRNQLK